MRMKNIRIQEKLLFLCFLLLYAFMIVKIFFHFIGAIFKNHCYSWWEISDWFINFQGGFVRRGITGEVMFQVYQWFPYSPKIMIVYCSLISFILFFARIWQVCKRTHVTPLPILLVITSSYIAITWYRRDFLILFIVSYVFDLFIGYLNDKKKWKLLCAQLLMCLTLLIHEGSFFFMIPILIAIDWFNENNTWFSWKKIKHCFVLFALPLFVLTILFINKGGDRVAEVIWESWTPAFKRYPESESLPIMGNSVAFLKYTLKEVFGSHLSFNFEYKGGFFTIMRHAMVLSISLITLFYLFLSNIRIDIRKKRIIREHSDTQIPNILLVQLLFMGPMFTVLSCDYARTFLYAAASTYFVFYSLKMNSICIHTPKGLHNYSKFIQNIMNKYKIFASPWTCYIALLWFPLAPWHYTSIPSHCYAVKAFRFIMRLLQGRIEI